MKCKTGYSGRIKETVTEGYLGRGVRERKRGKKDENSFLWCVLNFVKMIEALGPEPVCIFHFVLSDNCSSIYKGGDWHLAAKGFAESSP